MGNRIWVSDNTTIKWTHNGERYCVHIRQDTDAEDPRHFDSNLTEMACFVKHHRLGDEIGEKDGQEFWQRLVRDNVPKDEILRTVEDGKLHGLRLAKNEDDPELYDIYEMWSWGKEPEKECLEHEGVCRTEVADYILDDLSIVQCQTLMHPYAEFLPVWAYIHSGVTVSCGDRSCPYNDVWDSGLAGWIVALKRTIIECMPVPSKEIRENQDSAEQAPVAQTPGADSQKDVKTVESRWRLHAREVMRQEVDLYDEWLREEVYGYILYSVADQGDDGDVADDDDETLWKELESVWGFYGDEPLKSGLADDVAHGLREALENGTYQEGKAEQHTLTYFTF